MAATLIKAHQIASDRLPRHQMRDEEDLKSTDSGATKASRNLSRADGDEAENSYARETTTTKKNVCTASDHTTVSFSNSLCHIHSYSEHDTMFKYYAYHFSLRL